MKMLEIKKVRPGSAFKATLYMMIVPSALCLLLGIIVAIAGVIMEQTELIIAGGVAAVVYPLVFLALYGGITALMALLYNLFANKFGGLEIEVKETDLDNTNFQ